MSYKVLVIDDEPLIARSISHIIPKANSSFEVSDICYNGRDALASIQKDIPDVVFTDIQMPIMDGLALAHEIRIHFPSIHIVILSGYSEFEYAQKAIRENVRDYLLKPLNREKVAKLLDALEKELQLMIQSRQLELWNQILHHPEHLISTHDLDKYLPYESYCLLLTCCGPYFHSTSTPSKELCSFWKSNFLFENCWNLLTYIPFWIVDGNRPNEKLIIIGCNRLELPELMKVASQLHASFCNYTYPITSVAFNHSGNALTLSNTLVKMRQHLRQQLLFGKSSFHIYDTDNPKTNSLSSYFSEEKKRYLTVLFTQNRQEKLYDCIIDILYSLCENDCEQILFEKFMKEVISLFLSEIDMESSLFLYLNTIYDITASNFEYDALREAFIAVLDDLFKLQDAIRYENLPQNVTVQQVRAYIEEHYSEPMNIQTLAMRFGVVAPYLSKLYFDYYHSSLKNDILQMRLKKAKELLTITPPLPLREIAELTGFNDPFYFSKVFKQQHAISPIDFRKMINENISTK